MSQQLWVEVQVKAIDKSDNSRFCEYAWAASLPIEYFQAFEQAGLNGMQKLLTDSINAKRAKAGNASATAWSTPTVERSGYGPKCPESRDN